VFLFILSAPFSLIFFLNLLRQIGTNLDQIGIIDGELNEIGKLSKCSNHPEFDPLRDEPCLTVGYSFFGQDLDNIDTP